MPVLKIVNFLAGINYAVEPTYIKDNQSPNAVNVVSTWFPPINSPIDAASLPKLGAGGRGTLRQCARASIATVADARKIEEYAVLDPRIGTSIRQQEVVVLGTDFRIASVRDQGTSMVQSDPVLYYNNSSLSFSPNNFILGQINGYIIASVYGTAGAGQQRIWDGTFETGSNVSVSAVGHSTVTGSGTSFAGAKAVKTIGVTAVPDPFERLRVGQVNFTFVASTVTASTNEIQIDSAPAVMASKIFTALNAASATVLCCVTIAAGATLVTLTANVAGEDFALVDTTAGDLTLATTTINKEGLQPNDYINFNGESTGGESSTGWYRITSVANATSMTFQPSRAASVNNASFVASRFQKWDPLDLQWRVTAIGEIKGRAIIGTYSSDGIAYLYVSEVNDPKTVMSSVSFKIGDAGEKILSIRDAGNYVLCLKENSAWAFILNGQDPNQSSLFRLHKHKGVINDRGAIETDHGIVVLTPRDGFMLHTPDTYVPIMAQLGPYFNNPDTNLTRTAVTWAYNRLLFAIPNQGTASFSLFSYDIKGDVLEREDYGSTTSAVFPTLTAAQQMHIIPGLNSFRFRPKICYGSDIRMVLEHGYFDASPTMGGQLLETSVPCAWFTKTFTLGDSMFAGVLRSIILEYNSKDLNPITITTYVDGSALTAFTITPPAAGFNRARINIPDATYRGEKVQFQISFVQQLTNNNRPTKIYRMYVLYDLERRIF